MKTDIGTGDWSCLSGGNNLRGEEGERERERGQEGEREREIGQEGEREHRREREDRRERGRKGRRKGKSDRHTERGRERPRFYVSMYRMIKKKRCRGRRYLWQIEREREGGR